MQLAKAAEHDVRVALDCGWAKWESHSAFAM